MDALNTYSVKQLKNIVSTHNASEKVNMIKAYGKMKKPELINAINKQIKQEHLMKILEALKISTIVSGETMKIKVKRQPNKMETKMVEEMLMMMEEGGSKVAEKIRKSGKVDEMTSKQEQQIVDDFMKMMESQGSKMTEKVKKSADMKPKKPLKTSEINIDEILKYYDDYNFSELIFQTTVDELFNNKKFTIKMFLENVTDKTDVTKFNSPVLKSISTLRTWVKDKIRTFVLKNQEEYTKLGVEGFVEKYNTDLKDDLETPFIEEEFSKGMDVENAYELYKRFLKKTNDEGFFAIKPRALFDSDKNRAWIEDGIISQLEYSDGGEYSYKVTKDAPIRNSNALEKWYENQLIREVKDDKKMMKSFVAIPLQSNQAKTFYDEFGYTLQQRIEGAFVDAYVEQEMMD